MRPGNLWWTSGIVFPAVISILVSSEARTMALQDSPDQDVGDTCPSNAKKRVACYYTNWAQYRSDGGKYLPENIDVTLCTHIIYAFAKLENGVLAPYEWNDDSTPWMKGMYERVNDLKKQKPGLKTLLAVGGWNMGSTAFSRMVATRESRQKFALHAVDFLRNRTFDGLEMDWEYPGGRGSPPEDKQRFTSLLQEVRQVFDEDATNTGRPRLMLTSAVAAGKTNIENGYEIKKINQYVDWLSLMSYDLHGSWENVTGLNSPLYARQGETGLEATLNQDWAARYWLSHGTHRKKLLLGLALYGRSFTLQNAGNHSIGSPITSAGQAGQYTREGGFLSYYEICRGLQTGWTRVWDDQQKTPYAYKDNQWVGYDDEQSITIKAQYINSMKLGGALIWTLDLDDFGGQFCAQQPYPLLTTLNNILKQDQDDDEDDTKDTGAKGILSRGRGQGDGSSDLVFKPSEQKTRLKDKSDQYKQSVQDHGTLAKEIPSEEHTAAKESRQPLLTLRGVEVSFNVDERSQGESDQSNPPVFHFQQFEIYEDDEEADDL